MSETVGEITLRALSQALSGQTGLTLETRDASIVIKPVDGAFSITVFDQGEEVMLAADRWHTHYDDPNDAVYCTLWLLTPYYRLVHELKGGVLVAAWIERYEPDGWQGFEPVYFLNPDHPESWLSEGGETLARRTFQQAAIPPPVPYEQMFPNIDLDDNGHPPGTSLGVETQTVAELVAPTLAEP
mgnify:CR=1 FL=1